MPLVTVIIAVHNQAAYIAQAIRSVLEQTMADLELLVVDDGSTDDSAEVIHRFPDPRVVYRYQQNRERSAARNVGIRAANGEYLCFLDADDYYLVEKLSWQVAALRQRPDVGVVYSDVCLCDASGACLGAEAGRDMAARPSGDILGRLVRRNWITLSAPLFRRGCFHEGTLFDEGLSCFEDWDLWLRIARETRFLYHPGTVACYRVHGEMTSRNRERMWRGALVVRRTLEGWPEFEALPAAVRQYSRLERGLLECLVGDPGEGRRVLAAALRRKPRMAAAAGVWAASLLGPPALRALWGAWAARRDWMRAAREGQDDRQP